MATASGKVAQVKYEIMVSVRGKYYASLAKALEDAGGAFSCSLSTRAGTVPPDELLPVGIKSDSLNVLDALRLWLKANPDPQCELQVAVGQHVIRMRAFCERCQGATPCNELPSTSEWCPLIFVVDQAGQATRVARVGAAAERRRLVAPAGSEAEKVDAK